MILPERALLVKLVLFSYLKTFCVGFRLKGRRRGGGGIEGDKVEEEERMKKR